MKTLFAVGGGREAKLENANVLGPKINPSVFLLDVDQEEQRSLRGGSLCQLGGTMAGNAVESGRALGNQG